MRLISDFLPLLFFLLFLDDLLRLSFELKVSLFGLYLQVEVFAEAAALFGGEDGGHADGGAAVVVG